MGALNSLLPGHKHQFYTTKSFYTLAGTSTGVWIFSAICGEFVNQSRLRWLALGMAFFIAFVDAARRKVLKPDELLVTFFNGLLIYSSATGINAISTGTAFQEKEYLPRKEASLLPFLNEKAWWQPVELVRRNAALQNEGATLQRTVTDMVKGQLELRTDRMLNEEKILGLADGKQREVIRLALKLYKDRVPYRWGGKSIQEGFDSSGYVAYILARIGVIDDPETYWSGKIKKSLPTVPPGDERIGDVIFYSSGACMIYLGDGISIGMLPGGIAIGSLETPGSPFKRLGVGRY